jgi:hypothetical protein
MTVKYIKKSRRNKRIYFRSPFRNSYRDSYKKQKKTRRNKYKKTMRGG